MFPVGILLVPAFYRITRSATLEFAGAQYVEAAELLGGSKLHVIRVHVVRPHWLTRTTSGKWQRGATRERLTEPTPARRSA